MTLDAAEKAPTRRGRSVDAASSAYGEHGLSVAPHPQLQQGCSHVGCAMHELPPPSLYTRSQHSTPTKSGTEASALVQGTPISS